MVDVDNEIEIYEVSVVALVPVKRLVRVKAVTETQARELAIDVIVSEAEREQTCEWSIPSRSRASVDSDQDLLGPSVEVHHSFIENAAILTGMCPTRVRD